MIKHSTTDQVYDNYNEEDHDTWSFLVNRHQQHLLGEAASKEYLLGYDKLKLDAKSVVDVYDLSKRLSTISGWSLVPVSGLMPTKEFFLLLANKTYPVTVSIRRPYEIDFSEQPDIFHDVFGHIPLLTNEKFIKFLSAYSIIALKYANNEKALELLGRLYWFTYEMGLIFEDGDIKPYGGAIITSSEEIANVRNVNIPKHEFDINKIFNTAFNPYTLQKEYFVIKSFDDLFNCLETLEVKLIDEFASARSNKYTN